MGSIALNFKEGKSKDKTMKSFYIEVKKYVKLKSCQRDFRGCFEDYIYRKIGCKMFDTTTSSLVGMSNSGRNISTCNSTDQIKEMDKVITGLVLATQKKMLNITGCLLPCQHLEYAIKGNPTISSGWHGLRVTFVSEDMTVLSEVELYPFESFLAEFGGALGLFTGFSFMFFADLADWLF